MSTQIQCSQHGHAGAAYVCSHALEAFRHGSVSSFYWTDADKPEPCGWCHECHQRYLSAGEEWAGEAEEKLEAQLVCEHCFRDIIKFNGFT